MEMIKIKVKGIDCRGDVKTIIHKYKLENEFKDIVYPLKVINGFTLPETIYSKEEQIINHLDNIFFGKMMQNEYDLYIILDYNVLKPKQKQPTIEEIIRSFNPSEEYLLNFMATYIKMKPSLKGMSNIKKVDVVMNALNVGLASATNVYREINDWFKPKKLN